MTWWAWLSAWAAYLCLLPYLCPIPDTPSDFRLSCPLTSCHGRSDRCQREMLCGPPRPKLGTRIQAPTIFSKGINNTSHLHMWLPVPIFHINQSGSLTTFPITFPFVTFFSSHQPPYFPLSICQTGGQSFHTPCSLSMNTIFPGTYTPHPPPSFKS